MGSSDIHNQNNIDHSDDDQSNEVIGNNHNNNDHNDWLFDEVTGALGPRGITADLESLGGRSQRSNRSKTSTGGKSHRSTRSHRSTKSHKSANSRRSTRRSHRHGSSTHHNSSHHHHSSHRDGESVGSKNSHISHRSSRSTRSHLSHMSEASRSVANDLLRLEMQLAMVGSTGGNNNEKNSVSVSQITASSASVGNPAASRSSYTSNERYYTGSGAHSVGNASRSSRKSRSNNNSNGSITNNSSSTTTSRRSKITITAPPGKLGIILANKFDTKGTVISGVRSSSVLVDKLHPGDRIISVDGEDVSRMTVAEITTIMARKNDFERVLTILTTPKTISQHHQQHVVLSSANSPTHNNMFDGNNNSYNPENTSVMSNNANGGTQQQSSTNNKSHVPVYVRN